MNLPAAEVEPVMHTLPHLALGKIALFAGIGIVAYLALPEVIKGTRNAIKSLNPF